MSKEMRQYINKVKNFGLLINEQTNNNLLSTKEQEIIDDILSLNENINFKDVINKIKDYSKKGLITTAILTSLLSNNAFSQEQKKEIENSVKIENQIDNEFLNLKELEKIIKKEGFEKTPGTPSFSGFDKFKIYRAIGENHAGAANLANARAKNPIRSFEFSRKINGNVEVLIVVPYK
jgi:hypothetical protein